VTFADNATFALPDQAQIIPGTYRPTDYELGDNFSSPAPPGPYASSLSAFNSQGANGAWSLYVTDDGDIDGGAISGWTLSITTAAAPAEAPVISDISDQFTTINTPTTAITFMVSDADTPSSNLLVTATSSNPILV